MQTQLCSVFFALSLFRSISLSNSLALESNWPYEENHLKCLQMLENTLSGQAASRKTNVNMANDSYNTISVALQTGQIGFYYDECAFSDADVLVDLMPCILISTFRTGFVKWPLFILLLETETKRSTSKLGISITIWPNFTF